ncbi:MAG: SGNH/GDSL hydrolase family protein [Kastovskya adunca ATA6-11-RM4]|jgi:lysophospholipase L1-like esterase|nr:SGNH/GDSL hydrolase family protein [Kastovskya adunca ATA6-11-RM4]
MKFSAKYWIPGACVGTLAATEVLLRLIFGLGNPVLVQADAQMGYRFQPNQKIFRFGRRIEYNQYSMRSEPINPQSPLGTLRIVMTGDSVLNGGNPTDQKETISELFETKIKSSNPRVEVLNASAGSWGIGNHLGYLREFGTFNSDAVILQIGTHDLTQPTSTSDRVGTDPNYPTSPPLFAVQEAWTRYAFPRLANSLNLNPPAPEVQPLNPENAEGQFEQNMQKLKAIASLVRAEKIPLFVLYTPDRSDLIPQPKVPPYQPEFLQLLKSLQIPVVDTHQAWSTSPQKTIETYFRDNVHLSVAGNQAAANLLFEALCPTKQLPDC